jgi:hypothetical protein
MLNENAKKWVAALRSGDFRQGKCALLTEEGYCCLGVACALHIQEGLSPANIVGNKATHLPEAVREWFGLRTKAGQYNTPSDASQTWLVNDNDYGKSFAEIANIIESEPEGLFKKEEKEETNEDQNPQS